MTTIHIARFCASPRMGVFGELRTTQGFGAFTVEPPWADNKPGISCIPAGTYEVVRDTYHAGGYAALQVQNVPGRSEILLHRGNTRYDTEGCLVVGGELGWFQNKRTQKWAWGVGDSKTTFEKFMESIPLNHNIELRIVWSIPPPYIDPTTRV